MTTGNPGDVVLAHPSNDEVEDVSAVSVMAPPEEAEVDPPSVLALADDTVAVLASLGLEPETSQEDDERPSAKKGSEAARHSPEDPIGHEDGPGTQVEDGQDVGRWNQAKSDRLKGSSRPARGRLFAYRNLVCRVGEPGTLVYGRTSLDENLGGDWPRVVVRPTREVGHCQPDDVSR